MAGLTRLFAAGPKRLSALLLALTLVLLLTACGEGPDPEILRFGIADRPVNLDPRFATDAASERINRLLYARLVDFDEHRLPIAGMADWEQLGPTHYRFRLLPTRAPFADGRLPDATDVKASYDSVLAADSASPHRGTLSIIQRVEVEDAEHVSFHLHRADALFPAYLDLGILPAEVVGGSLARAPRGSGPFELDAWLGETGVRLRRRADGARVEFVQVKNPTVRSLKLVRGEIDLTQNDLPPELQGWLEEQPGLRLEHRPGANFTYLGFNLQDPATGDPRVRRAVALAIDRASIIHYLLRDGARPASALLPPEHWAGAPDLPLIERDLPQARRLLAEAGYDASHPLELSYKTSADPFRIRLATVIQGQLAEAGIRVRIQSYDWGTFFGDIKAGRFQMYSLTWVGIRTPDIFRYAFHSDSAPPNGANRGRYASALVDALIDQAIAAPLAEQAPLYREIQALLLEDLPYVPLWYESQVLVSDARLRGYPLAADGRYDGLIQADWSEQPADQ